MSYQFSLSGMTVPWEGIANDVVLRHEPENMKMPSCFQDLIDQVKELQESGEKGVCFVGTIAEIERFKEQTHGSAILGICRRRGIGVKFKVTEEEIR